MYTQYFGLKAQPFRLTPDPYYFFTSATHKSALAYMRYGMQQGEGFIVVTGAAGTGKTTLALTLSGGLARNKIVLGELVTTQLQPDDLLRAIAAAFELDMEGSKSDLIVRIQRFLSECRGAGKHVLLVVDEAHDLPQTSFEELRMLSNFHLGPKALLQCILLGQLPLREMLNRTNMEQFQQRVIAAHHLHPLSLPETRGYILHRLQQAGWRGDPSFTSEAIKLTHQYTQGIPRRINALCNRLMLYGFIEEKHQLDASATVQVYGEWMQELGQSASVETMRQSGLEETGITGLAQEHFTPGRAVGAHALAFQAAPNVQVKPREATRSTVAEPAVAQAIRAHTPHKVTGPSPPSGVPPNITIRKQRETTSGRTLTELKPRGSYTSGSESNLHRTHHLRLRANIRWFLYPLAALVGVIVIIAYIPADNLDSRGSGEYTATPSPSGALPVAPPMPETAVPAPAQLSQIEDNPNQHKDTVPEEIISLVPDEYDTSSGTSTSFMELAQSLHASPSGKTPQFILAGSEFAAVDTRFQAELPPKPAAHSKPEKFSMKNDPISLPSALAQRDTPNASVYGPVTRQKQRLIAKSNQSNAATIKGKTPVKTMSVSREELKTLLTRFRNAYDSGNISEIAKLFASDARSDDTGGRDAIVRSYQKLFNLTYDRQLALNDLRWQIADGSVQGEGKFGVMMKEKGRNWNSSYRGTIHIRIEKRDGQALISELNYTYVQ